MSDPTDLGTWDEITIRTPGWKARPEQVADFLRAVFPEDVVYRHQRRVAEAGLREAASELRQVFAKAAEKRGGVPKDVTMLVDGLLNMLDPDHKEFGGYFPSGLVCPHHDVPVRPPYRNMEPAFQSCPGVPRCRAGSGIRETRR
ncbi:hypothetical protein SEA_SATIS_275 [Streptomyces phage Satis]|nr:hypothetical protein SEA_SATIS_275 [Streptomyces phage Satis]